MEKVLSFHFTNLITLKVSVLQDPYSVFLWSGRVPPQARLDVHQFGIRGFQKHQQRVFEQDRAIMLGARVRFNKKVFWKFRIISTASQQYVCVSFLLFYQPPKKDYINYKLYQQMIKEKKSKEKEQEASTVGRRLCSRDRVCRWKEIFRTFKRRTDCETWLIFMCLDTQDVQNKKKKKKTSGKQKYDQCLSFINSSWVLDKVSNVASFNPLNSW